MQSKHAGKMVAIRARDHSSSMNLDESDFALVTTGTATVIAIGMVVGENDDVIHVSSFFSEMGGKSIHHEIHSILKREIVQIDILAARESIKNPF